MGKTVICKSCGAGFDESLIRCPYCGTAYLPAQEKEYNGKLDNIREEIKTKLSLAEIVRIIGKKAAILAVLLVGIIVMNVITSVNYSDPDPEAGIKEDALANAALYAGEIDSYLERGEYTECVSFMYSHKIEPYAADEYNKFRCVKNVASEYYECVILMEKMIFKSTDEDYFDNLDTYIRNFCMYLESYLSVSENMRTLEENKEYLAYIDDMDRELKTAMCVYFDMDENELGEFLELSQASKAVKIEEVLRDEK